jgi:hypothetical protein
MNDAGNRRAVAGQVEPSVRPDPERAAFERWAAQRWGAEAYRHTSATSGEWDAWQAGRESARARFLDALAKANNQDELEGMRAAIARACAGYPADDAAPTCVAILRAALGPNV